MKFQKILNELNENYTKQKYYVTYTLPTEQQKIVGISIKDSNESTDLVVDKIRFLVQTRSKGPISYKELNDLLDYLADKGYDTIRGKGVNKSIDTL